MSMTAREAMQALLDGKTLMEEFNSNPSLYKLDDEGNLEVHNKSAWWKVNCWTLSHMMIYEEYSLTFEQALRAMLDGKIVGSDLYPRLKQRFHEGCFESNEDDTEWKTTQFAYLEQKAKWKVIE